MVARNERNCGIGLALLSEIQKWAISCGASRMDLLADKRNNSALNFYRQQNWKRTEMIALHKKL